MPSKGTLPALISHLLLTESVGTAFRVVSGGGRLTLTYRTLLAVHIAPDVAFSQIHGKFKNGTRRLQ